MAVSWLARDELRITGSQASEGDATDEALAAVGNAESFTLLYRRYLTPIYRYLYARLGTREEAEDVTGLAWERVLESLSGYRPTGPFRAWLFTIARRALSDHYRHRRRHAPEPAPTNVDDLRDTLFDPQEGPEELALALDETRLVLQEMSRLGDVQQEILTLRFMADLPYAEIAQVVGKREAAVKMMAYRALAELRRVMRTED